MKRVILLLLLICGAVTVMAQDDLQVLTYGETVEINITDSAAVSFALDGSADEVIYLALYATGGNNPAYIRLFSPNGALLQESRVGGDSALIEPFSLPATGRYLVSVQRPDWSDFTGRAFFVVDTVTVQAVTLPDETFTGQFDANAQLLVYTLEAEKNMLLRWQLTCDLCSVGVKPPDESEWYSWGASNFIGEELMQLTIPGTYTIYIQNRASASPYSLWVNQPQPTILTVNEPFTGSIQHFGTEIFSFNSAAGKIWQVSSVIPDGSRAIEIRQLDNRPWWDTILARDTGSGGGGNAQIQSFIAPEAGTYYVLVSYVGWSDDISARDFEIMLQPDTLRQLAPGTVFTENITPESGAISYLYEGTAGQTVLLTLERLSEDGSPSVGMISPVDEVAVFNGRSAKRVQMEVTLPETGRYQVTVSNIAYDNSAGMEYSILLEVVPES